MGSPQRPIQIGSQVIVADRMARSIAPPARTPQTAVTGSPARCTARPSAAIARTAPAPATGSDGANCAVTRTKRSRNTRAGRDARRSTTSSIPGRKNNPIATTAATSMPKSPASESSSGPTARNSSTVITKSSATRARGLARVMGYSGGSEVG